MAQGLFISLDGVDGCGKSTQCRLLADWLRRNGHSVTETHDPGGTPLGEAIRDLLLHSNQDVCPMSEALLFMASRAQLIHDVMKPALAKGEVVICDRYLLSTIVYQGYAGSISPELLHMVGKSAADGLEPQFTVVLDLPEAEARKRMPKRMDRIERRGLEYFERVRNGFLQEAREHPEKIAVIDASQSVEMVHKEICSLVQERFPM